MLAAGAQRRLLLCSTEDTYEQKINEFQGYLRKAGYPERMIKRHTQLPFFKRKAKLNELNARRRRTQLYWRTRTLEPNLIRNPVYAKYEREAEWARTQTGQRPIAPICIPFHFTQDEEFNSFLKQLVRDANREMQGTPRVIIAWRNTPSWFSYVRRWARSQTRH